MKYIIAILCLLALPAHAEGPYRPTTIQTLGLGTVSASATNAIGAYTEAVRLVCTADCYVAFVTTRNLVLTSTTGIFMPADHVETFSGGQGEYVIGIVPSSTGTLSITEMTK